MATNHMAEVVVVLVFFIVIQIYIVSCVNGVIQVSVVDLRSNHTKQAVNFGLDMAQLTQLLYGDAVTILVPDDGSGFTYVSCAQPLLVNGTWQFYEGYIESSAISVGVSLPTPNVVVVNDWVNVFSRLCNPFGCLPTDVLLPLSMGTQLYAAALEYDFYKISLAQGGYGYVRADGVKTLAEIKSWDVNQTRTELVKQAKKLLGQVYFWGGRSAFNGQFFTAGTVLTGCDCSGLTSLSYKSLGRLIPRDASPQFNASRNVTGGPLALQSGDLLFLANQNSPFHMYHVMMVMDSDYLIESSFDTPSSLKGFTPKPNNATRIVSYQDKFGLSLAQLRWGQLVPYAQSLVYYGTML